MEKIRHGGEDIRTWADFYRVIAEVVVQFDKEASQRAIIASQKTRRTARLAQIPHGANNAFRNDNQTAPLPLPITALRGPSHEDRHYDDSIDQAVRQYRSP